MYKFEKIDEDNYKLIINDKEFTFTRTIDLARELQSVDMYTTYYVAEFLADRGETLDNTKLRIERKENGKTIIDESNLEALKKQASSLAYYEILNRIFKKTFNIDFMTLLKETGITDTNEIGRFTADITKIFVNGLEDNTPRE